MAYPYEVDLASWTQTFPPDYSNNCGSPVGPYDFVASERRRSRCRVAEYSSEKCLTDTFVWARGEPDVRSVTKVGGLPYRPESLRWPKMSETGAPMTFLAQFSFSGSKDLVGDLPGEVLLVFAEDETFGSRDALRFEWHALGIEHLVSTADLPSSSWEFATCFGYRCRLTDYACTPKTLDEQSYDFATALAHSGTKIGGRPYFLREREEPGYAGGFNHPKGRFIAQLADILPSSVSPYPWINCPDPEPGGDETRLTLVDGALIHLFVDESGIVEWGFEFG